MTLVFAGDFNAIIAGREQEFLNAVTSKFVSRGASAVSVMSGSILIEFEGSPEGLAYVRDDIDANDGKLTGIDPFDDLTMVEQETPGKSSHFLKETLHQ